jgi:uncharacterized repeat protein (TIGR01451 family)/LPXTG-motif cell wall-anchored protein
MKQLIARFGLPALAIALLLLAGLPGGALPLSAAPLAAVTGTPTEPPTPTSTVVASATPTPIVEPTVTPTNTPRPRPPSDSDVADPAITKSASVAEARVGDEVTFTLTVTNKGDATAHDVVVTDALPEYLDVLEVTATRGDVSTNGRTVTVTIGAVEPGDEVTIRIRTRVNELAQPPGGRNGAALTTSSPGDDPSNNFSEVSFGIVAQPTAVVPTEQPTPTPEPPRELPRTGSGGEGSALPALAALGLLAVGLSLLARRRVRR